MAEYKIGEETPVGTTISNGIFDNMTPEEELNYLRQQMRSNYEQKDVRMTPCGCSAPEVPYSSWRDKVLNLMRWIVMLPTSFVLAIIAQMVVAWGSSISLRYVGIYPDTLFGNIHLLFTNIVFGIAFVVLSAYIAPAYKKQTSFVVCGLLFFFCGIAISGSLLAENYWNALALPFQIVGGVVAVMSISKGEIDLIESN